MGSLSKYRGIFMGIGLVIFLGGAVARWHRNRTMGTVSAKAEVGADQVWKQECLSYSCRILHISGSDCEATCNRATEAGTPRTRAERIAYACSKSCTAEEPDDRSCPARCLVRQSKFSAGGN